MIIVIGVFVMIFVLMGIRMLMIMVVVVVVVVVMLIVIMVVIIMVIAMVVAAVIVAVGFPAAAFAHLAQGKAIGINQFKLVAVARQGFEWLFEEAFEVM